MTQNLVANKKLQVLVISLAERMVFEPVISRKKRFERIFSCNYVPVNADNNNFHFFRIFLVAIRFFGVGLPARRDHEVTNTDWCRLTTVI